MYHHECADRGFDQVVAVLRKERVAAALEVTVEQVVDSVGKVSAVLYTPLGGITGGREVVVQADDLAPLGPRTFKLSLRWRAATASALVDAEEATGRRPAPARGSKQLGGIGQWGGVGVSQSRGSVLTGPSQDGMRRP